jgi:hypothetical protein
MGKRLLTTPRSKNKKCKMCGVIFVSKKKGSKYCSPNCSNLSHRKRVIRECCICGKKVERKMNEAKRSVNAICSRECLSAFRKTFIGEKSTNWLGGKRTQYGYVLIKRRGHPNATKDGYVMEHRLKMSDKIGRPLENWELVHHKNGIRNDNRIENLELLTLQTHFGEVSCPHCNKKFFIK